MVRDGWIEVVVGCMFSGKSTEAAKRVVKETLCKNREVLIFTPRKANRHVTLAETGEQIYTAGKMVSRSGKIFQAIEFNGNEPQEILAHIKGNESLTTVVIEEAHFCSLALVQVCKKLAEIHHLRVIVVGLDQTFSGQGFGPIPDIMIEAEYVTKELAVCTQCGSQNASKTWLDTRELDNVENGDVLVGDQQYTAVCRHCHRKLIAKYG